MKITSFAEFTELARQGTFVPVCKEIVADLLDRSFDELDLARGGNRAFFELESFARTFLVDDHLPGEIRHELLLDRVTSAARACSGRAKRTSPLLVQKPDTAQNRRLWRRAESSTYH